VCRPLAAGPVSLPRLRCTLRPPPPGRPPDLNAPSDTSCRAPAALTNPSQRRPHKIREEEKREEEQELIERVSSAGLDDAAAAAAAAARTKKNGSGGGGGSGPLAYRWGQVRAAGRRPAAQLTSARCRRHRSALLRPPI
jgi:hypothetical protein